MWISQVHGAGPGSQASLLCQSAPSSPPRGCPSCLVCSQVLFGLSLALAPLLTQERGCITVSATLGGSRTAHPPQCLVLYQDSVYLLAPAFPDTERRPHSLPCLE